jgi:hypothetical protein
MIPLEYGDSTPSADDAEARELLVKETVRVTAEEAKHRLKLIQLQIRKRRYREDPAFWAEDRLGETLWSAQKRIMEAVRDHRRVAVASCHEVGKSFIASRVCAWWIDGWPVGQSFVVTSAPSAAQVRAILWREIGRAHAKGNLTGRVNQTEWHAKTEDGNEELIAVGRKPDDYTPTAFQGIHAPRVLYVFDEACGMPKALWEAGDSLIANDDSHAFAIGNPDDPTSEFAEICKPGSGWKVIHISAFDTPNFTGEELPVHILKQLIGKTYVEEKRRKWAPQWKWNAEGTAVLPPDEADGEWKSNPLWQSKVLGRFPLLADKGGLIPLQWIIKAQQQSFEPGDPNELGVDVGGGGDSSTTCHRRGNVYRIISEDHNPDTMQTCGKVISELRTTHATSAKVDVIGIGRGVVDRAVELKKPVIGINVAEEPYTEEDKEAFVNLRAALYWNLRTLFEKGQIDIDPNDEDLAGQLAEVQYFRTSTGKIQIESKADAKKRGVPSPNRLEALMLAAADARKKKNSRLVW